MDGAGMFWIPVLAYAIMGLWLGLSILFAPFAGAICMWLAHRRGLNVYYYGLIGAAYSVLFLLPGVYLMIRLSERTVPRMAIAAGYVALYLTWCLLLWAVSLLLIEILDENRILGVVLLVSSGLAFVASLWPLKYEQSFDFYEEYTHTPHDLVYIMPFLFAFLTEAILIFNLAVE